MNTKLAANLPIPTIAWLPDHANRAWPGCIRILDQTRLPEAACFLDIRDLPSLWDAI